MFVLCDVALGKHGKFQESLFDDRKYPISLYHKGFDCFIRVGNEEFDDDDKIEIDGAIGYCGKIKYKLRYKDPRVTGKRPNYTNEYMVFNEKRINIKAIVIVNMACHIQKETHKCRCSYQSPRKKPEDRDQDNEQDLPDIGSLKI